MDRIENNINAPMTTNTSQKEERINANYSPAGDGTGARTAVDQIVNLHLGVADVGPRAAIEAAVELARQSRLGHVVRIVLAEGMPPVEAGIDHPGIVHHVGEGALVGVVSSAEAGGDGLSLEDGSIGWVGPVVAVEGSLGTDSGGSDGSDLILLLVMTLLSDEIVAVVLTRRYLAGHRAVLKQFHNAMQIVTQLLYCRLFASVLLMVAAGQAQGGSKIWIVLAGYFGRGFVGSCSIRSSSWVVKRLNSWMEQILLGRHGWTQAGGEHGSDNGRRCFPDLRRRCLWILLKRLLSDTIVLMIVMVGRALPLARYHRWLLLLLLHPLATHCRLGSNLLALLLLLAGRVVQ